MAWYKHTPTNLGWLWRGAQSAIFFYVSCAPCQMHAAAKKQQKENRRAMAERDEQMRLAEGMFYSQPLPRQTNAAWRSEIDLGVERPSMASERKVDSPPAPRESRASSRSSDSSDRPTSRRHTSSRGSGNTRGKDAKSKTFLGLKTRDKGKSKASTTRHGAQPRKAKTAPSDTSQPRSRDGKAEQGLHGDTPSPPERVNTAGPDSSMNGAASLSTTLVTDGVGNGPEGGSTASGDGSQGKKRRYQRPMEPLWGLTRGYGPPSKINGLEEPKPEPDWYVKRNPEVNDLHPPVVGSLPKNKKEALWMLQPPPPAAFMEGHIADPGIRTRSNTGTTRSTSRSTNTSRPKNKRRKSPSRAKGVVDKPILNDDKSGISREASRKKKRPGPLQTIKSEGV